MTDRHAENRRILEYFEKSPDRARSSRLNPLFSGRAEVMDKLIGSVEVLLAEPEPLEGMTHVVHGAPGAGKSECMFQFMDRLRRLDRPDLIVAQAGVEALFSARELWGAIQPAVTSMRRVATGSLRDRLERLIDEIESFAVLGVSFRKTRRNEAGPSILQTDLLREMAEKLAALLGNPTVVLCIDEIQSMQAPGEKDWTGFASRFELGRASLKIMPVYFGLGNSPDVLGDHGLSRLAEPNVFPLRGIDEEAVSAIARRFLEAFEDKAPRDFRQGALDIGNRGADVGLAAARVQLSEDRPCIAAGRQTARRRYVRGSHAKVAREEAVVLRCANQCLQAPRG